MILLDLPGHGQSSRAIDPEKVYTIEGYAECVQEIFNKLNLNSPIVVGWSLGGHIGLNLIQKGIKLAGLVLTGTPPINISQEGFQQGFNFNPRIGELFSKIHFTGDEASEFMQGGGFDIKKDTFVVEAAQKTHGIARFRLAQSLGQGVGGDQKNIVETDDTPLCIIQGEKDEGINNDYILKLNYRNLIGNVHILKGARHAVFREYPEEFNQILNHFLSTIQ